MTEGACYRMKPHHIPILVQLSYLRENERCEYIKRKINDYSLDCQRKDAEDDFKLLGRPVEYSGQFILKLIEFYRKVFEEKGASLKVVGGLDDICMLDCNRKIKRCESESAESIAEMEKYDMHIDDVLPISLFRDG